MANVFPLLIGTYTKEGSSKGVYLYSFDTTDGTLTEVNVARNENPSFLTISRDGRFAFSANENDGQFGGSVTAYEVNASLQLLQTINSSYTLGGHPCHVSTDATGKWLVASNYSGGNFSVFRLDAGAISDVVQTIQHTGSGPHENQDAPHIHSATFSADNNFLYVCDLGTDGIYIYPFDAAAEKPVNESGVVKVPATPGSGPRHLALHPSIGMAYVINELSGTISLLKTRNPEIIKEVSLVDEKEGDMEAADIHITQDGRYLYASLRGNYNCINVYSVGTGGGDITFLGKHSSGGIEPRNFALDPSGDYLLAANHGSGDISVFRINKASGALSPVNRIKVPSPVCVQFVV
jgi:6-phosphogluconolactonase